MDITSPTFVPDVPGDYEIRLVASDSRGLSSQPGVLVVSAAECGSAAPVATLSSEPAAPVVGETVLMRAVVEDADLDGGDGDTCTVGDAFTYEWLLSSLPPGSLSSILTVSTPNSGFVPDVAGEYVIEVNIFDAAGHENAGQRSLTINVVEDEEPSVAVTASPQTGLTPLTVAFTCDSSTGEEPFSYAWSFGNGQTSTIQNPTFTYNQAGTFSATCVVTDANFDTAFDSETVDVVLDTAPEVQVGANPRAGVAPLAVDFTSVVSNGNGTISYAWTFEADGTSAEAQPSLYLR